MYNNKTGWRSCCCSARISCLGWVVCRANKICLQDSRWLIVPRCCRYDNELFGRIRHCLWFALSSRWKVCFVALSWRWCCKYLVLFLWFSSMSYEGNICQSYPDTGVFFCTLKIDSRGREKLACLFLLCNWNNRLTVSTRKSALLV